MTHFGRRRRRGKRRFGTELAGRLGALPPIDQGNGSAPPAEPERRALPFEFTDDVVEESVAVAVPVPEVAISAPATAARLEGGGEPPPVEPSADEALFRAAREANASGQTGGAIALYRELLSHDPRHVRARNNLALLLEQSGEHEQALEELDACLVIEPGSAPVLVNRGAVLGSLARYQDAERDLRAVLEAEPDNAEAHFNLGLVISRKGLWSTALPHLRRAIELDPTRAMAYFYLGEALNRVDDLQGALQAFQRAADLRPSSARVLWGLGIILDRLNRPEEAAQMYRRSRDLSGR